MNRLICFMICLFFLAPPLLSAGAVNDEAALAVALVGQLSENLEVDNLRVKIGPLYLEGTRLSGKFADNLLSMILVTMRQPDYQGDFVSVEKARITKTALTRGGVGGKTTRGGLISSGFLEADQKTGALLTGSYHRESKEKRIVVNLRLTGKDGKTISEAVSSIPANAITVPLRPSNQKDIRQAEEELDRLSKPKRDFRVQLWIDKGNGGVYKQGETLKIFFRTEEECYLKVLYVDASGNRILIYPTAIDSKDKLKAKQIHELHANNLYTIQPPFGAEMIVAFASTLPFNDGGEINLNSVYRGYTPSRSIAGIAKDLRGISVEKRSSGKHSETRLFLTSVK